MPERTIGQHLKELRKAHGYTQYHVASYLNIITQTYSHYETGRIIPPAEALYHLAKLYHIPVETLLNFLIGNQETGREPAGPNDNFSEDIDADFLSFINDPQNDRKFKNLKKSEKELLYYYNQLSLQNRKKILEMIKLEWKYQKK